MLPARDNPFRLDRVLNVRYRPLGATMDQIVRRFDALGRRAAIVGAHGSGKTTLLEDLEDRLRARGEPTRRVAPRDVRSFNADEGANVIVTVDSAGLLPWHAWATLWRVSRRARGVLLTAHRATPFPTLARCTTTPGLLASIVRELDPEFASRFDARSIDDLFARHRGNLRHALAEVYDRRATADPTDTRPIGVHNPPMRPRSAKSWFILGASAQS